MPTIGILGRFPDRDYADSFIHALRTPGLEIIDCSHDRMKVPQGPLEAESLHRLAESGTDLIIVVFSTHYISELRANRHLDSEIILQALQRFPNKIVPITYDSDFNLPGAFNSLQLYDVQRLGAALLLEAIRDRLAAATPGGPILTPHPRIHSVIKEAFPGKSVESLSGPIIERERNIGYELFKVADRDFGDLFVVHTYEPITIRATAEHFNTNFRGSVSDRLYLIASRDRAASNPDARLDNLKQAFAASEAWYVDTFIANRLAWPPNSLVQNIPDPKPYFVDPWVRSPVDTDSQHAIAFLEQWRRSGNPVLVVQGAGGIGKTQLLRKFAKEVSQKDRVSVVYLDSVTVIDYARKHLMPGFYLDTLGKIIEDTSNVGQVSQDRLETLLSSDSFLIILDGMDEIIPRLPTKYQVADFFASVQDAVRGLDGGKLLVSCRNSFWDPGKLGDPVSVVDLAAFDEQQIDKYLLNRFSDDPPALAGAKRTVSEMRNYFSKDIYPFMLDLACRIRGAGEGPIADKSDSERKIFNDDELLDEVLWHVCRREAAKFGEEGGLALEEQPLDVGTQTSYLTELALLMDQLPGEVRAPRLKRHMEAAFGKTVSAAAFSAFKSHPLLDVTGDTIRFSYDFIEEFFLALVVKQTLTLQREITSVQATFLTSLCRLESNFLRTVARKVGGLTEEVTLGIAELLSTVKEGKSRESWERDKRNPVVGGATNIGLQCLLLEKWDITAATKYLRDLFGTKRGTELVDLVLFAPNSEVRVIFSFEGLKIKGAEVIDYDNFLRCRFDKQTQFESSVIFGGQVEAGSKTTATAANFDDSCSIDPRIREQIRAREDRGAQTNAATERYLKEFLRTFRLHGSYRLPRDPDTLQGSFRFTAKKSFAKLLEISSECGLVNLSAGKGGQYVQIRPNALNEVEDFVGQGLQGKRIRQALQEISGA